MSGCRQRQGSRGGCRSGGRAVVAGAAVPAAVPGQGACSGGPAVPEAWLPSACFRLREAAGQGGAAGSESCGVGSAVGASGCSSARAGALTRATSSARRGGGCVTVAGGRRRGAHPLHPAGRVLGSRGSGAAAFGCLSPPCSCLMPGGAAGQKEARPWGAAWGRTPAWGWLQRFGARSSFWSQEEAPDGASSQRKRQQVPHPLAGGGGGGGGGRGVTLEWSWHTLHRCCGARAAVAASHRLCPRPPSPLRLQPCAGVPRLIAGAETCTPVPRAPQCPPTPGVALCPFLCCG